MAATTRDLLTQQQAAVILGVTDRTVRNWQRKGYLPAHRVGPRLIRVSRADIEAMLKAA